MSGGSTDLTNCTNGLMTDDRRLVISGRSDLTISATGGISISIKSNRIGNTSSANSIKGGSNESNNVANTGASFPTNALMEGNDF